MNLAYVFQCLIVCSHVYRYWSRFSIFVKKNIICSNTEGTIEINHYHTFSSGKVFSIQFYKEYRWHYWPPPFFWLLFLCGEY
jgi:hypothetical protein